LINAATAVAAIKLRLVLISSSVAFAGTPETSSVDRALRAIVWDVQSS
jgi:hypothetical protein